MGPHVYCQIWLKCPVPVQSVFLLCYFSCLLNCEISKKEYQLLSLDQIQRHKEGKALACTIWKKNYTEKKPGIHPRVVTRQGGRKLRREEGGAC